MHGDEDLGHAPVQEAPLGGARLAVGHVPQLVVGEVVSVRPLLADDAPPPQLVERAHDPLLVAHQAHEDVEVEGAAHHGRGGGVSRAWSESWARRPAITACARGGRPGIPCSGAPGAPPPPSALTVSTMKRGLPSVSR